MRWQKELHETSNSSVYKKARKLFLENNCSINCAYCPYHRRENFIRHNDHRTWKKYRKTQYKMKKDQKSVEKC